MVSPITIDGLSGFTQNAKSETITNQYRETVSELQAHLNSPTETGTDQVENLVNKLKNLLINGVAVPVDAAHPNGRAYLTPEMANQLTLLFESLRLAGYDTSGHISINISSYLPDEQDTALLRFKTWRGLVNSSQLLQSLYNFASTQYVFERSLQAMVELDYVKTGNDLLSEKVADLDSALSVTKNSLDALASLQNLHNEVSVESKGSFTSVTGFKWNPTPAPSPSAFAYSTNGYVKAASSFFGVPITPGILERGEIVSMEMQTWQAVGLLAATYGAEEKNLFLFGISGFEMDQAHFNEVWPWVQSNYPTSNYMMGSSFNLYSVPTGKVYIYQNNNPNYIPLSSDLYNNFKISRTLVNYNSFNPDGYFNLKEGITFRKNYGVSNPFLDVPYLNNDARAFVSWFNLTPISNQTQSLVERKNELVRLRDKILAQINALIPITPLINGQRDPDSLLAKLQTVYDNINDVFKTSTGAQVTSNTSVQEAYDGLSKWLLDGYNLRNTPSANLAGKFQQNITFAITAGQSLNDQQKEQVRRFLYVFEEFYKSASAILQKITQILERMAQAISR